MWVYPVVERLAGEPLQRGELLSLEVWGKIGRSGGLGMYAVGKIAVGDSRGVGGIYQRRHTNPKAHNFRGLPGTRPKCILMKTYSPTNPQTIPQQANRSKFSAAVTAWQILTDVEKAAYTQLAAKRGLPGYQFFLSRYLKSH